MSVTGQLASPSTLQKYGFYWQTLFANPRRLLGPVEEDGPGIKPSDAIVFSVFNLTLAVVLQDRVLFSIHTLSPEAVLTKVAVYVLFSLIFWLAAGFAFEKGRTAGWVAGLTASAASCAIATILCSAVLVAAIALGSVTQAAPVISLDDPASWANEGALSVRIGGYVIDHWSAYHVALVVCAVVVGVPTVARMAKRPFLASAIFVGLFTMLVLWSNEVSRQSPTGTPGISIPMATVDEEPI